MPTYTYRREDGTTFDYRQSFSDDPLATCPTTGQRVTRVIQAPGIIFKGSGFYVNDSKNGKSSTVTPSKNGDGESSSESLASDSKAETKSEAKTDTKEKKEAKETKKAAKTESAAD